MLGLHTLGETLIYHINNFDVFLNSFVPQIRLHQDMHAIIGENWSPLSQTTSLRPTLDCRKTATDRWQPGPRI